jgi:hypothetical protein
MRTQINPAANLALHYLAKHAHQLSEMQVCDLVELVHSSNGRFDPVAARRAREWLPSEVATNCGLASLRRGPPMQPPSGRLP